MNSKGFQYDFMAKEWSHECSACGYMFYTPTLKEMRRSVPKHTKGKDCLNGY